MPYADPEVRRARQRLYYQENRERIIAKAKDWAVANPEKTAARLSAWRKANPERSAELGRSWYLANRETVLERTRLASEKRLKENPELVRANNRASAARRRARQSQAFVENVDPMQVWLRDEGICGICGLRADSDDWHLDHVVSLARGGKHSYANVQVSHPKCNQRKAAT